MDENDVVTRTERVQPRAHGGGPISTTRHHIDPRDLVVTKEPARPAEIIARSYDDDVIDVVAAQRLIQGMTQEGARPEDDEGLRPAGAESRA